MIIEIGTRPGAVPPSISSTGRPAPVHSSPMQHTDIDATPPGTGPMSHRVGYNRHRATSCRLAARPWSTTPSTFHSCIRAPPSHEVKGPLPPIDRDKGPLTPGTREPSNLSYPCLHSHHASTNLPDCRTTAM